MKRDKLLKETILAEYLSGGITYRQLAAKYGVTYQSVQQWVTAYKGKRQTDRSAAQQSALVQQVDQLQAQLRKAQLENKLLKAMIDIAQEQLGIDIRKKSGAKRS
jgi:transposase